LVITPHDHVRRGLRKDNLRKKKQKRKQAAFREDLDVRPDSSVRSRQSDMQHNWQLTYPNFLLLWTILGSLMVIPHFDGDFEDGEGNRYVRNGCPFGNRRGHVP